MQREQIYVITYAWSASHFSRFASANFRSVSASFAVSVSLSACISSPSSVTRVFSLSSLAPAAWKSAVFAAALFASFRAASTLFSRVTASVFNAVASASAAAYIMESRTQHHVSEECAKKRLQQVWMHRLIDVYGRSGVSLTFRPLPLWRASIRFRLLRRDVRDEASASLPRVQR